MRSLFPNAHLEVSKSPLSAFRYCCDTTKAHVPGSTITQNAPTSNGQGSRTDIATAARLAVDRGIREVHRTDPATAVRYSHHLMRHVCMVSDTGLDHSPCDLKYTHDIKQVPRGAGEIVKINGQFRFDVCIDRETVFYYGPLTQQEESWLTRPYTWLMDVKGSTYPRKFKVVYVVNSRGSIVLPAPTLGQNFGPGHPTGNVSTLSKNSLATLLRMANIESPTTLGQLVSRT